jgi:protein involved in polysaccharide export with SLBB domain
MKFELVIAALAVALSGCTGSKRGNRVPVFSEVSSPAQLDAHIVTRDSPATNTYRNAESEEVIQVGNALLVTFTNLPSSGSLGTFQGRRTFQLEPEPMPAFEQRVKDDGTITLMYCRVFQAAGKKAGELEKEIQDYYIPAYFLDVAVRVQISTDNFVYLDGEFRNPGRYSWTNGMRLKDAIDLAQGFSEFAGRLTVIHADGTKQRIRLPANKIPSDNPKLKGGDVILCRGRDI